MGNVFIYYYIKESIFLIDVNAHINFSSDPTNQK